MSSSISKYIFPIGIGILAMLGLSKSSSAASPKNGDTRIKTCNNGQSISQFYINKKWMPPCSEDFKVTITVEE